MRALILNCLDHLPKTLAISKRFAAGQSSAMACSSGSSVTFTI